MHIPNHLYSNRSSVVKCFLLVAALVFAAQGSAQALRNDTIGVPTLTADSVQSDSVPKLPAKKSMVDAQIVYEAKDSVVLLGNGTAFLHGSGDIKYKDIVLTSNYMRIKMDSSTLYAKGTQDSTGVVTGNPVFTDNSASYESKEMTYNLRTKKGFIKHVVTQQGEGYIISEQTKKTDDDLLCMSHGKYTTCDCHDAPHFYLALTKAKVKPGNYIAAGPSYLVVADVPLPLALPFGFFPFTESYSSGVVMPSYGDDFTRGFYLNNGGYYFAINDYLDAEITGDIYTKGTWAVRAKANYVMRYKFRGSVSVNYRSDVTGEKDLDNYSKATNFSLNWNHSQDAKASMYSTLSASVNFATSGYNRSNINSYYDTNANSQSTTSSSVNYTQRFPDSPWNLSASMNLTQRNRDSTINMTLPNLSANMSRIYPLKRKNAIGKERWYEKIAFSYSGVFSNSIETKENKLLTSSFVKDWRNGIRHSIPISASFTVLKYINITPSVNYNERWYFNKVNQDWDKTSNTVVRDTTNGFFRVWDFSTSIAASTKIYGFFMPSKKIFGDKIDRFRHVLTPNVSFSWSPDFGSDFFKYKNSYIRSQTNPTTGAVSETIVEYSPYDGMLYGRPSFGENGSINFSLQNNLEMKIRNDKDTTGKAATKIISLIDNFSISGGYNLAADSMNWQNFSTTIRIKFGKAYTLSLGTSWDPYMYALNASGQPIRVNKLRWNHGKFPRFLGTATSFSYSIDNNKVKGWLNGDKKRGNNRGEAPPSSDSEANQEDGDLPNQNQDSSPPVAEVDNEGYRKTKIQWGLHVSYTVGIRPGSEFNYDKMEYNYKLTNNLQLSGNISLGEGWRVSTSTSYDFEVKKFTTATFNVTRNLHCWTMTGSFVPFGPFKSYTFRIGVNASMLADLKYERLSNESTNTKVNWW